MKTGISFQTVELALNNFCSLSCKGCPSVRPSSLKREELIVAGLLEKLKYFQVEKFVLCGNSGEPLEHSGIEDILLSINHFYPKSKIHLSTNGELLFDKISIESLKLLRKYIFFQIALDGPNQNIHELTRGGGDFQNVLWVLSKLKELKLNFEIVYTRHLQNEEYTKATAELVNRLFDIDLKFRDTTHTTLQLQPPLNKSPKNDVSFLFNDYDPLTEPLIEPNKKFMYINHNGDAYPCVSFVKYKTQIIPPNIFNHESWIEFMKKFLTFQQAFCHEYRSFGDKRQCLLNCGVYNSFCYDTVKSLNAGNND